MNYQKNLKYFKSTDTHYYIGLPIFALGAIFFIMGYIFWTYLFPYQNLVGIALIIIGAIVAFVPRSFRSSEKDIDDAVTEMTKDYETTAAEELGITSLLLREQKPLLIGTYTYENDALYRRGKIDRKFRSDHYTAAALLFTKHGICISEKQFSLTEDSVKENIHEFRYTDIDGLFIETTEQHFTNEEKTTVANLIIKTDGKPVFSLPVTQNAVLERTCDDINLRINRIKKD